MLSEQNLSVEQEIERVLRTKADELMINEGLSYCEMARVMRKLANEFCSVVEGRFP